MRRFSRTSNPVGVTLAAIAICAVVAGATIPAGGTRVFLLIERAGPAETADLLARSVTVVGEFGNGLLAFAGDEDLRTIENSGYTYRILDDDISN